MTAHKLAATKLEGGKKAGTTDTHANDTDNERDQAPKHAKQQQQPAGELEVDDRFGSQQAVMEVTGQWHSSGACRRGLPAPLNISSQAAVSIQDTAPGSEECSRAPSPSACLPMHVRGPPCMQGLR
jgi:hypothetical protein